ncbi:MAG: nucleotidyltransferase family protein [Deltaproteobacteria bacterium]|nr:nucleotidyltransferase family protein [Deltaproteobacteria bacterium]
MYAQKIDLPIKEITALCKRYNVRELAVFGSAVKNKLRSDSDIDLLVEFEPDAQVGFITLFRMQRELSGLMHRKVDLVPKGGLKPILRHEILSAAKVLYAA